jgi:hypothetical protein
MKPITSFTIGAATFSALQIFWSLGHAYSGLRGAWIMKTGLGIGICFAVFVLITAVVCVCYRKSKALAKCGGAIALGAIAAMTVALFLIGPGNLWPIVIAFDGAIIGAAVAVGAAIGALFRGRNSV